MTNALVQGLDLEKLALKRRFTFIDGLTRLYTPKQRTTSSNNGEKALNSDDLASISNVISQAIKELQVGEGRVLLVIDHLDLLLAAGGPKVDPIHLGELLLGWREVCFRLHVLHMEDRLTDNHRLHTLLSSRYQQICPWLPHK